jgi:hypothetical protein
MDTATSAVDTTIKSPISQTNSKSQLPTTNTKKTLAVQSGNTNDPIDYVNKWLRQYTAKTPVQIEPKRTLYRPTQWGEMRYGYLKTQYDTSIDMIIEQIAWTTGKRIEPQVVCDVLVASGHQFMRFDTQIVCVTIEFERKGVLI